MSENMINSIPKQTNETCCICLGDVREKALLDMCLHFFCFECIKIWSEKKATCPLCTVPFRTIMYNIKSDFEYLEHKVADNLNTTNRDPNHREYVERLLSPARDRRHRRTRVSSRSSRNSIEIATDLLTRSKWNPSSSLNTFSRRNRRQIYKMNLWAKDVRSTSGNLQRVRDVCPNFLAQNEACCHRLQRWLNREIPAVLGHSCHLNVSEVTYLVIENCKRFFILSGKFYDKVCHVFSDKTRHFVHEFYHFASSPYDMEDYDRNVTYGPPVKNPVDIVLDSDIEEIQPFPCQDSTISLSDNDDDDDDDDDAITNSSIPGIMDQTSDRNSSHHPNSFESLQSHKHIQSNISEPNTNTATGTSGNEIDSARGILTYDNLKDDNDDDDDDNNDEDDRRSYMTRQNKKLRSIVGLNHMDPSLLKSNTDGPTSKYKKHHSGHKNRSRLL